MAFGGSAVAPPSAAAAAGGPSGTRQVKLERECELRIEVSPDSPLRLRILAGTAEIFGTEIAPEIWLSFPPGLKFAVSIVDVVNFNFNLLSQCVLHVKRDLLGITAVNLA